MLRLLMLSCLGLLIMLWSCQPPDPFADSVLTADPRVSLNPSGVAPLTATLGFTTKQRVMAEIRVKGRHGESSDVVKQFDLISTAFELPVLGLYAAYLNQVELSLFDLGGQLLETYPLEIQTSVLLADLPEIDIDVIEADQISDAFFLVNYFGFDTEFRPQRPFIFDQFGDIRWYLDFSNHSILNELFYDNGMTRMLNGNLLFGDGQTNALYEIDMMGEVINSWSLQGYGFHHHVIEKPNGNFLVTVNDPDKPTVEDVILEIDRRDGAIIRTWDLNESLDNQRRAWETDLADLEVDWFHANALFFDPTDESILVSGRTQGVVKLSPDNEVIWMLAPHLGWDTAGNGRDLTQVLLQPLDAGGQAITDQAVLDGQTNHPDFEWSWYQHSPIVLPNGHVMIFDNGDNRNYGGSSEYSRAVEYAIDEDDLTIQQVWAYGKERGSETYSRIVSKVTYDPDRNHVLMSAGAVDRATPIAAKGRIVEIDRATDAVRFEATIRPPTAAFGITFHSVYKLDLYP